MSVSVIGVTVWASLTAANFIYQALSSKDWLKMTEISFFQGVAIGAFFLFPGH